MTGNDPGGSASVLVIDPSDFGRTCTVAGLEATPGLSVRACASVGVHEGNLAPDVVLFQISDPAAVGNDLKEQIVLASRRWPSASTLVVAEYSDATVMIAMIKAGAHGLLTSAASLDSIRSAILLLVDGIGVYPSALTTLLRREIQDVEPPSNGHAPSAFDAARIHTLTKRQQEVLNLLALGCSNKVIAQELMISESTVKVHIRAIMAQNGTSNRTQIVAHFLKNSDR